MTNNVAHRTMLALVVGAKSTFVVLGALVLVGCGSGGGSATGPAPAPVNRAGVVNIAGEAKVQQALTATVQDADGLSRATIIFQWLGDGEALADATSDRYTPTSTDVGKALQVRARYTDDAGFNEEYLSLVTATVADLVNREGTATIAGVAKVGETLTASVADADGISTAVFSYQWRADGAPIAGATNANLGLTPPLAGSVIDVRITYTDDERFPEDVLSVQTSAVAPLLPTSGGNFPRGTVGDNDSVPAVNCDVVADTTAELESLTNRAMAPGVTVCLADGQHTDLNLDFGGTGTQGQPITVAAQNPGQATVGGEIKVRMSGEYAVLQGIVFRDGTSADGDFLQTRSGSSNPCHYCRVTEVSIIDIDDRNASSNKWVSIYGQYVRVDHNWFSGKANEGALLVVWRNVDGNDDPADTEIDYAQIDHNYFGNRPPADGKPYPTSGDNGYEAVRIGTSDSHSADSLSILAHNYFERIDGESEVISNKSGSNLLHNNTIRDSFGALTLRHGSSANVTNNFIIGDDHPFASGIRVIDDGHRIVNNYIAGVRYTTTSFHGGIVLHTSDGSTTNGYQVLTNVLVAHNTIVDSVNSLSVAGGNSSINPQDVIVANNLIADAIGPVIVRADDGMPASSVYAGNYVFGGAFSDNDGITSFPGFTNVDALLADDALGIARPSGSSPDLLADTAFDIGGFDAVTDDMDGQLRTGATESGADHDANDPVLLGLLTSLDVGPIHYTPPASPGSVIRMPIVNPGFDTGMVGWVFDAPAGLTTTAGDVHARGASAEVSSLGRISQTLAVEANTNYTLSAFTRGPARLGVVVGGAQQSDTDSNSTYKFTQMSFSSGSNTSVTIFAEATGSRAFFDGFRLISHAAPGPN